MRPTASSSAARGPAGAGIRWANTPSSSAANTSDPPCWPAPRSVVQHLRLGGRSLLGNPLLVVSDLRTGRVLRRVHTGGPPLGGCRACDGLASAVALKPDGSLAWVVQDGYPYRTELRESDRTGSRTLAAGGYADEVEEPSLTVQGNVLHWTPGRTAAFRADALTPDAGRAAGASRHARRVPPRTQVSPGSEDGGRG